MKLICFPHYTCGGLLCDILNGTFSDITPYGGISSIAHSIGKIGDTDTVYTDFLPSEWLAISAIETDEWISTHCWPGTAPTGDFESIICVTTSTWLSKLYRWLRAYHHHFLPKWGHLTGIELTDKMRETAKNYHAPFLPVFASNIINLEFADVVENTSEFQHIVKGHDIARHIDRWQLINKFLYDDSLRHDPAVNAFYQAEVELNLQRYYRYE